MQPRGDRLLELRQQRQARRQRFCADRPSPLGPNRAREVRIVGVARDQVPVQMRRHVAEACDVHLVGRQH